MNQKLPKSRNKCRNIGEFINKAPISFCKFKKVQEIPNSKTQREIQMRQISRASPIENSSQNRVNSMKPYEDKHLH